MAGSGGAAQNRQFMRSSLLAYVNQLGLSTESTLVLMYLPSVTPPERGQSQKADDWIGAVAGSTRYVTCTFALRSAAHRVCGMRLAPDERCTCMSHACH